MKEKIKKLLDRTVKVSFINTYMGKLGSFYKGRTYEISDIKYKLLKKDCEKL